MWKKNLTLVLFFLMALSANAQVPSVTVEDLRGETVNIREIASNKLTVFAFWSSVCKPCLAELDAVSDVIADWHKGASFQLIAIAIDDNRNINAAKSLANGHAWNFDVLFDKNQDMKRAFGVNMIPRTFVYNAEGKLVYTHTGYAPGDEDVLFEQIKKNQQ
jgi:cytochrome c biogenesis protein CcmG/thiol:disulfide interchange protein DsbE